MKVLILGASGLVGGKSLQRALTDPRVEGVIAPTRRPLPGNSKLLNPVAPELDSLLPDVPEWAADSVICALGTMIGRAGSKEAFRHIDYGLPLAFANLAHQAGAETFALTSSIGASASSSFFYTRTKGELERDIQRVGFKSLSIVRPSIIGGDRGEFRLAERLLLPLAAVLTPILPQGWRISSAARIAEVLVEAAVAPRLGLHLVLSKTLN